MVSGDAVVRGGAVVYGNAHVYEDAVISGVAMIYGNARVYGNAMIYGNANISDNNSYCCFQSFGSSNRTTTAFREKDGNIRIDCGCFSGTITEFKNKVIETHGDSKYAKEYLAIIEVIKIKFDVK